MIRGALVCAFALTLTFLLGGCSTLQGLLGIEGSSQVKRASLATSDGARILLWRWAPKSTNAQTVLVLPELGFDHRLVAPLCQKLWEAGFDVATLDGREATGARGRYQGMAGWTIDVARAVAVQASPPILIGIGLAGQAALTVAELGGARGVIVVNVPIQHEIRSVPLRLTLKADGYNPKAWLEQGIGALLVATGKAPNDPALTKLFQLVDGTTPETGALLAERLHDHAVESLPAIPIRALIAVKDNLVPVESALPGGGAGFTHTRRLGIAEGYKADYGHLDWLVDANALNDVAPMIVEDLEAIP